MRRDGTPQPGSVDVDGAALVRARRRKERVYPELTGRYGRARLVVLAGETGGRWSSETQCFLRQADTPRTATSSHQRQVGLAAQVEHDVGVQWCSCIGVVPDGGSHCCWTRSSFCSTMGRILIITIFFEKVLLYVMKEETFPIPLKFIDVNWSTHTDLDVMPRRTY